MFHAGGFKRRKRASERDGQLAGSSLCLGEAKGKIYQVSCFLLECRVIKKGIVCARKLV